MVLGPHVRRSPVVSKTAEYALRAMVFLAWVPGHSATAKRIGEATLVPVGYLSKVLHALAKAGIVTSQRGPAGGFCLAKPATEMTLLEVVQEVEPIRRVESCPLGLSEHDCALCPLHSRLDQVAVAAQKILGETSLDDLIEETRMPLGKRRIEHMFSDLNCPEPSKN